MLSKIIGITHIFFMIIINLYGFIKTNNNTIICDYIYIISFVSISLSWLLLKDECLISYIDKKYSNPNYILGSEPYNVNDIIDLFPSKQFYNIFYIVNHFFRLSSIIIVNNRLGKASWLIVGPMLLLYSLYVITISISDVVKKYRFNKFFRSTLAILLIIFLFINIIKK